MGTVLCSRLYVLSTARKYPGQVEREIAECAKTVRAQRDIKVVSQCMLLEDMKRRRVDTARLERDRIVLNSGSKTEVLKKDTELRRVVMVHVSVC